MTLHRLIQTLDNCSGPGERLLATCVCRLAGSIHFISTPAGDRYVTKAAQQAQRDAVPASLAGSYPDAETNPHLLLVITSRRLLACRYHRRLRWRFRPTVSEVPWQVERHRVVRAGALRSERLRSPVIVLEFDDDSRLDLQPHGYHRPRGQSHNGRLHELLSALNASSTDLSLDAATIHRAYAGEIGALRHIQKAQNAGGNPRTTLAKDPGPIVVTRIHALRVLRALAAEPQTASTAFTWATLVRTGMDAPGMQPLDVEIDPEAEAPVIEAMHALDYLDDGPLPGHVVQQLIDALTRDFPT